MSRTEAAGGPRWRARAAVPVGPRGERGPAGPSLRPLNRLRVGPGAPPLVPPQRPSPPLHARRPRGAQLGPARATDGASLRPRGPSTRRRQFHADLGVTRADLDGLAPDLARRPQPLGGGGAGRGPMVALPSRVVHPAQPRPSTRMWGGREAQQQPAAAPPVKQVVHRRPRPGEAPDPASLGAAVEVLPLGTCWWVAAEASRSGVKWNGRRC